MANVRWIQLGPENISELDEGDVIRPKEDGPTITAGKEYTLGAPYYADFIVGIALDFVDDSGQPTSWVQRYNAHLYEIKTEG